LNVLATGIDIVDIERIRRVMRRHGESFERRVLSPGESRSCPERFGPRSRVIAMRWAAKEAVLKILGTGVWGEIGLDEIEIIFDESGRARTRLSARALELLRRKTGAVKMELHLSVASSKMTACSAAMLTVQDGDERDTP
jgi:holo-[acyl-carrier protein] synthase